MKRYALVLRILLVGLLFYPTLAQHTHVLLDHDHPKCDTNTTHFHEAETHCDLLDYVTASTYLAPLIEGVQSIFFETYRAQTSVHKYQTSRFSKHQRGPPTV